MVWYNLNSSLEANSPTPHPNQTHNNLCWNYDCNCLPAITNLCNSEILREVEIQNITTSPMPSKLYNDVAMNSLAKQMTKQLYSFFHLQGPRNCEALLVSLSRVFLISRSSEKKMGQGHKKLKQRVQEQQSFTVEHVMERTGQGRAVKSARPLRSLSPTLT